MKEYPAGNRLVILGRPNVGKSTLFNRICGRRRSLVGDEPGMTRDRIYAPAEWRGKRFEVIDTGGLAPGDDSVLAREIFNQARTAMSESGQCLLVVDAQAGLTPLDEELAARLRREGRHVTVAVNKIDTASAEGLALDFYRLGIPSVFPVSSEHGRGIDDLLDHATRDFAPAEAEVKEKDRALRVAIIGRPNAGKSTLLNRLTGMERAIVTAEAGTTRDAVDEEIEHNGRRFIFIDTAGIRRKGKTRLVAEKLSVIQARKQLERCDVALLLIDAKEGAAALDSHIGGYAHESRRSVVIVVNKWDAGRKGGSTAADFTRQMRGQLKFLNYAPVVFVSALHGQGVQKLLETVAEVSEARVKRVATAEMNRFLQTLDFDRAPSPAGRPLRLYYLTQAGVSPPTFVAFTNRNGPLYFSVARFLENRIREQFGFAGAPIVIQARRRGTK